MIRLGLIGDHIGPSRARWLYPLAGRLCGIEISYVNLVPADLGKDFGAIFDECHAAGFRGINVTYPYKEVAFPRVDPVDDSVAAIGAINTVVFGEGGPVGHNTDFTGFVAAFRATFAGTPPGRVAMVGAGGVGKAVGFGLLALGAEAIRVVDIERGKASALAAALRRAAPATAITHHATLAEALEGADGVVNCTPVGMTGHSGTPVPPAQLPGKRWAFDAVYTPVETDFLVAAKTAGLAVMSGYELFFHQAVDAFRVFTGCEAPQDRLRRALAEDAR